MILLVMECVDHASLKIFSSLAAHLCISNWFFISDMFMFLTPFMRSLMNASSSLLSFFIALKVMSTFSSFMLTSMMSGTWSEGKRMSGLRVCLLKPGLFGFMNTRSRTELVLYWLSVNLVGPEFIGIASSRSRLSVMDMRSSVWMK